MTPEADNRLMWQKLRECINRGFHYWVYAHRRRPYCWDCFHGFWKVVGPDRASFQARARHYLGFLIP